MAAVLVTEPSAMHNSLFLPQQWLKLPPVLIACTTYLQRDGRAEWPGK